MSFLPDISIAFVMEIWPPRLVFLPGTVAWSVLCLLNASLSVEAKPVQERPGIEEPISGSALIDGRNLAYVVNQNTLVIELQGQYGREYSHHFPASKALLAQLLKAQNRSYFESLNDILDAIIAIVEDSSVVEKQEIVQLLLAIKQK